MNYDNLTRAELIYIRMECDKSLLFFTRFWFRVLRGSKFIINDHHQIIADHLKLIEEYKLLLLNINIPPRFSKTEIAAVNFIARGIGMNPASNWLYITASDELRAQTSVSIRDIVQHPYFKIMYGVDLKRDQNGKNLWRTNKGGGLKTATIFGQITGFGAGQMIQHNDELTDFIRDFEGCIVMDDINKIDDSSLENSTNEKVSRVMLNTVLSRVNSKDTPIVNIQQRAGNSDATAILQNYFENDQDKVKFLVMPVVYPDGRLLWEWKCGHAEIERLRNKSASTFETQYMQNPTPLEGLLLPIQSLQFDDLSRINPQAVPYRFAVGDPADQGGDKFSTVFIHLSDSGAGVKCYVRKVLHNTHGIMQNTPRITQNCSALMIDEVFIESNGVGTAAVVDLKHTLRQGGGTKLTPFPSTEQKEVRILSNFEFIRDYFVFDINYKDDPEYRAFISDLTGYIAGDDRQNKHKKDAIDVLSTAAQIVKIKFSKIIY